MARRIDSVGVIEALADAMCLHGIPEHIRCDDGPDMISKALRNWVAKAGSQISVHRASLVERGRQDVGEVAPIQQGVQQKGFEQATAAVDLRLHHCPSNGRIAAKNRERSRRANAPASTDEAMKISTMRKEGAP